MLFGKSGGPKTLKANEALEEALCFGWIDGQMQSIDDKSYIKYFAIRGKDSKWSDKNKALVGELEKQGLVTDWLINNQQGYSERMLGNTGCPQHFTAICPLLALSDLLAIIDMPGMA